MLTTSFLNSPSRLGEIYRLRVTCWEHSPGGTQINHRLFPEGWSDGLDTDALHWIVTDAEERIVASARLNVFTRPARFPYRDALGTLQLPSATPFAFFSRLVVHPAYRGMGLAAVLMRERLDYCAIHDVAWASAFVTRSSVKAQLGDLGFGSVGEIAVNYHEDTAPHMVEVFVKDFLTVGNGQHVTGATEVFA